uniref:Uncharacterized protein n=1 Tax=Romanomermis culicivorax TaxID=13658 RepID=A0A915IU28_ROMCU
MLPYRKPVTVVVGKPIEVERIENPSMEQINDLHRVYKEELVKLFEGHKVKYGVVSCQFDFALIFKEFYCDCLVFLR